MTLRNFIGAACLCGVGDTVALLMADQAFPQGTDAAVAKIGVLVGSRPRRRARRGHSRFRPEGPRHYASAGILTQPRA